MNSDNFRCWFDVFVCLQYFEKKMNWRQQSFNDVKDENSRCEFDIDIVIQYSRWMFVAHWNFGLLVEGFHSISVWKTVTDSVLRKTTIWKMNSASECGKCAQTTVEWLFVWVELSSINSEDTIMTLSYVHFLISNFILDWKKLFRYPLIVDSY